MNIIAGLLRGLAPLPSPEPREQDEANSEAQTGKGNAFGNVLSGLSQNSAAGADGTNSTLPQKPAGIRGNADDMPSDLQDGPAGAAPSNSTTVAQTLAALGELAALAEQKAANAANGNPKPANGTSNQGAANAQQQKGALADLVSTDGTSQQASNAPASRRGLADGAASPQLDAFASSPAPLTQISNAAGTFAKAAPNPTQGATGDGQPSEAETSNADAMQNAAIASLLTKGIETEFGQSGPAGGSNQPSSSKDANKDAAQQNAANGATTAFIANAAAMVASFQPIGTAAPIPGGTTGPRADADKPGAKSANATHQPASTTDAGNDPQIPSIATIESVAVNAAGPLQPQEPAKQEPMRPVTPIPAGGSAFSGAASAAANATSTLGQPSQTTSTDDDVDTSNAVKMTVLSTATHFAPPAQFSPIQQIATAVAGAIPGLSPASTSGTFAAPSADGDGTSAGGLSNGAADAANVALPGPAKVLNLQLEPPNLGTVTISLNLSSGGLDVQLAASQQGTASLIERDKTALSDQLRDSGYSVSSVAVSLDTSSTNVANDGSATQGQANQAFSQNSGQDMTQGGASNGNGGTGQDGRNRPLPETLAIQDGIASVVTGGSASGDLYI